MPTEFKVRYSEIPWRQIAGMRDVLVHEYFGVDLDLLWNTVKEDLPKLEERLSKVLRETKRVAPYQPRKRLSRTPSMIIKRVLAI